MTDQSHTGIQGTGEGTGEGAGGGAGRWFSLYTDRFGQRGWSGPYPDDATADESVPDGARFSAVAFAQEEDGPEVQDYATTGKGALRRMDERLTIRPDRSAVGKDSLDLMRETLQAMNSESTVIIVDMKNPSQDGEEDEGLSQGAHLALHLSSAHEDPEAMDRSPEENEAAHRAIPLHQHAEVQYRYERALAQKIEADAAGGTLTGWRSAPHPPHEVTDLALVIGDMHRQAPEMDAAMLAVDLAWIKTGSWPWHRRLRAAAMLAFSGSRTPSWSFGWRFTEEVDE